MGPAHHLGTIIMKFLLLIAAIAYVRAEADPAFTYATGYHLPYAYGAPLTYAAAAAPVVTYAHAPVVYTAAAGCQNEAGAVVPCAHGGVVPFGVVPAAAAAAEEPAVEEARKKREAEAEPEADPEAGRCLVLLPHPRLLAPWLRPPCLQLRSLRLRRPLWLLWAGPPLRLLRQEEEGGDR